MANKKITKLYNTKPVTKRISNTVSFHCPKCHTSNDISHWVIANNLQEILTCQHCKGVFKVVTIVVQMGGSL